MVRDAVVRRKALRFKEISGDEATKRKYWGTGKKIEEYRDVVVESVNVAPLKDVIDSISDDRRSEKRVSENLVKTLMQSVDFEELFERAVVERLRELVAESFKEGGSRLLTVGGDSLDPFDVDPVHIVDQLESQEIFLKRLSSDVEERVRQILLNGVDQGKSLQDMRSELVDGVESLTESRAETIARSEITKASSRGTEQAMKEAGVEQVQMLAEIDDRTCEPGTFEWESVDGRTFTSCREWHRAEFSRDDAPRPVRDSHPNCRCALLIAD